MPTPKKTPHPLLQQLPRLTPEEFQAAVDRIALYGRHEAIEEYDRKIVVGWDEYLAARTAKLDPRVVILKKAPPGRLEEYIIRRNTPRMLTMLQRAAWAVLAYQPIARSLARERQAEGGRAKAKFGQGKPEASDPWAAKGKRWFDFAAGLTGAKPWAVKALDQLRRGAPDVFERVRAGEFKAVPDAQALVSESKWAHGADLTNPTKNPDPKGFRDEVMSRYLAGKKRVPVKQLAYDLKREHMIATLPPATPKGKGWVIYPGDMAELHPKVADASVDVIVADILYGEHDAPPMARQVGRIAKRVLVEGGVLAVFAGHVGKFEVMRAILEEGLYELPWGWLDYVGGHGQGLSGTGVLRVDSEPIMLFCSSKKSARPIMQTKFRSGALDKRYGSMQKPTGAMTELVRALAGTGRVVLDPCCGSGTTGEACLRTGNQFIGIELNPDRAAVSQRRLVEVEQTLAGEQLAEIVRGQAAE